MAARAYPQPSLLRAVGISRVSLLKQVGNYSIEGQNHRLATLAQKYGFQIPDGFLLDDEGYSGTDFNRPSIRTALRLVRSGEANAVVFPYVDRFARNMEGGLSTIRQFREAGAQVCFGEFGWVTDETHVKMLINIYLMVAEMQRDSIAEKSRVGVETKIARGLAHGGGSPFGWHFVTAAEIAAECIIHGRPVPEGKPENVHQPVAEEIATLRLMGQLVLNDGHGLRSLCRELLARGIKSPGGNPRWNPWTVATILRNTCYSTGIWHYNKREAVAPKTLRKPDADRHRVKCSWRMRPQSDWKGQQLIGAPIWTPEEHALIVEALERNGRASNGKPTAQNGYEAILKSLVVCRKCGKAVVPQQKSTPAGRRCWYVCSNRDRVTGEHLCGYASIKAPVLEEAVWNGAREALTVNLDELVRAYRDQITATVDVRELDQLKAQAERLTKKKQEAMDHELDADDPDDKRQYANRVAEFKIQLALLRRRIASFTQEADVVEVDTQAIRKEVGAAWRTQDRSERREILLGWIKQIEWAAEEAIITLRLPLRGAVVNCQRDQPQVDSYILLKTKVRVAA